MKDTECPLQVKVQLDEACAVTPSSKARPCPPQAHFGFVTSKLSFAIDLGRQFIQFERIQIIVLSHLKPIITRKLYEAVLHLASHSANDPIR
jgi:hypothetical protein